MTGALVTVATGGAAGIGMGYVLQRGQLCFHSMIDGAQQGRFLLLRAWLLAVALAAVGLSVLFATPLGGGLDRGLPFAPVGNIAGGLLIGLGMVLARSCVSGLFFKLGAGMLGATIGLAGWAVGELVARGITVPGPVLLPPGDGATIPGLLGLPRAVVAVAFLAVVVVAMRRRRSVERPAESWQWSWPVLGVALGAVTVAGWLLAALGGSPFGPSSVGAVSSIAAGSPNWWLIGFLVGIVAGALVAARSSGGFRLRGEQPVRYAQLAAGGALLGAGGWIAGGVQPRARPVGGGAAQRVVVGGRRRHRRRGRHRSSDPDAGDDGIVTQRSSTLPQAGAGGRNRCPRALPRAVRTATVAQAPTSPT